MRVLLDTNRLTDALRRDPSVSDIVERAVEVWIPFVTLAEIRAGFLGGHPRRRAGNEALLAAFLRLPSVGVVYADRETTEVYARIFAQLKQGGTPIPTNDLWIASLAVQHQLAVVTRDSHFSKIPQLSLL